MKIRTKILILMMVLFVVFMTFFYSISYKYLLGNIETNENIMLENELSEFNKGLYYEVDSLRILAGDWAPWNETYEYIKNKNKDYEERNFNDLTLLNLKISLLVLYDNDNNLVQSKFIYNDNSITKISSQQIKDMESYSKGLLNLRDISEEAFGIIVFDGKPMIVSSKPITNSEGNAPKNGTLIMGRFIDSDILDKLENMLGSKISLIPMSSKEVPDKIKDQFKVRESVIIPENKNKITIYKEVKDLFNKPIFYIEMSQNRLSYLQGLASIEFYFILMWVLFLTLLIMAFLLINKKIIRPIENMSKEVRNIVVDDYGKGAITEYGNDEFAVLAKDINGMLSKIYMNNKEIKENEKKINMVLDGSNAGYWDYDVQNNILFISDKGLEILDFKQGEHKFITIEDWEKRIHPEDFDYTSVIFKKLFSDLTNNIILEYRIRTKSNEYKWIYTQGNIIEYTEEKTPRRILGIVMDIDYRKTIENEIKYLTYYDKLTGVFNRGYYEFNIDRIVRAGKYPLSIIIGDVDGLKITNDTFGHAVGDKLLQETAACFKNSCPEGSTICRWGGDEFIVILENCSEEQADHICKKIKNSIDKDKKFVVSISLGYATQYSPSDDINTLIKQTEEVMYHNKLLENKSSRNNTVSLLSNTLFEKSHETEEHASRIYDYCKRMGEKLKLSSVSINELSLLAKLHDIGKIGIPDQILNKPGRFNDSEFQVMKTHTNIGYRIAASITDFQHIAYYILCHHERYDGSGYPNGLKGEEIPLLSRILTIVDSFDVMTHNRPYKKSFSVDSSIEELKRCASSQFDPELVEVFIEVVNTPGV